jgi:hypothetical protein
LSGLPGCASAAIVLVSMLLLASALSARLV